jgi:hypothetical protein
VNKPTKSAIEIHLDNTIKGCKELWLGYKKWLQRVQVLLYELQERGGILTEEGDCYVRFNASDEHAGLNNLFFVFEIGRIAPTLRWRQIVRSAGGFSYVLLKRPTSYLPAFSFSLDKLVTLMYWGERVPFLYTMDLRNLKLRDFVLQSANASSVEVSAANLVWPRGAYPFSGVNIERLATEYIFNSLRPPTLGSLSDIWSESPIVLIGDRIVTLITIHKTLCTIDQKTVRLVKQKEVLNARAHIIDRNFSVKQTPVDIPQDYANEIFAKGRHEPLEVIFVRSVSLKYDSATEEQKPYIRYAIYPFESVKLFGFEEFGSVLSLASMKLRENYLQSKHPFNTSLTPRDLIGSLAVLAQLPFVSTKHDELAFRLLETKQGAEAFTLALGVYEYGNENATFRYIHPALLECFLMNFKTDLDQTKLTGLLRIAEKYLAEKSRSPTSYISPLFIEELFSEEFGTTIKFSEAKLLGKFLFRLTNLVIPLSKGLNTY